MSSLFRHFLKTHDLGKVEVIIPTAFPGEYGICVKIGQPGPIPYVRVHSRCFYGEVLGSKHCDCGHQLNQSLELMRATEGGYLYYLEQEGRGAGIHFKAKTYQATEELGVETFNYYEQKLGQQDLREYGPVAAHLKSMKISEIRLISNNPDKANALLVHGIRSVRQDLVAAPRFPENEQYLKAKRKRGHSV